MCGIAGFLTRDRLGTDASRVLDRMLAKIAHRGPDGPGAVIEPTAGLAIGHVRLAINDQRSTAAQPLLSSDGMIIATVAGEFYGFRRLRAELTARGERFATKSDSELVIALYRRYGTDFVEHLRGEFAIALVDVHRGRLVLARDRFGVRPLFYHAGAAVFGWASEAKALLAHPAIPRRLDRAAAVNQLAQVMVPGTTAFESVDAVRPGHVVTVDRDAGGFQIRSRQYWDLEFPAEGGWDEGDTEAHVDAVRRAVIDAVEVRLDADVTVGQYLSGGMDSGALLGVASALSQRPLTALTIGFEDTAYDESAVANAVADHHGVDVAVRRVTDTELYGEAFVQAVWHSERTFYNTLGIAKMHLARTARERGLRAVLSGEGADELFTGYPAFALDHAGGATDPADALVVGATLPMRPQRHPAFENRLGFTPGWVQPWVSTWNTVRPLLANGLLADLGGYEPLEAVVQKLDPARLQGRGRLDQAQYSWIKTMLEGQILNWGGDRVDMAHAIECRPVLLDHHVAEIAVRIPPSLRIRDGVEKWVLREALRHAMPEFLYRRRKFAFMAPPAHRSPDRSSLLSRLDGKYLTRDRIAEVGICDADRTIRFLTEIPPDPAQANEHDKIHNHLLGLHILHDLFTR
ncbi:asparagine synthase (glutamine-hydrolyzing) [Nocardia africana]|uniref:asparagine synthase (glutamine-hydrolyzing) n=1 Tax=Nocardia africana TaxID=134964 RepID=A0ABW6NCL1_9NOCA